MIQTSELDPDKLLSSFNVLLEKEPKIRAREAAKRLGVSEGELAAARVGKDTLSLKSDVIEILKSLEPLGEVMALTRNANCVHERNGVYRNPKFESHGHSNIGMFVNPDIDLRIFVNYWVFCFAMNEPVNGSTPLKSLQFFDREGVAVHKIYLVTKSDYSAYDALVEKFLCPDQSRVIPVVAYDPPKPFNRDEKVDWQSFREEWKAMQDTHDFVGMIRKFNVSREQAYSNIGQDFAYRLPRNLPRKVLDLAAKKQCEIMVFVGNRGCIQIHTGQVKKLLEAGPWYNVFDPKFQMHLLEEGVASAWVTKKPTEDGIVTAVEVFDKKGELIVTFFGKRKPGISELELWREIVNELPNL